MEAAASTRAIEGASRMGISVGASLEVSGRSPSTTPLMNFCQLLLPLCTLSAAFSISAFMPGLPDIPPLIARVAGATAARLSGAGERRAAAESISRRACEVAGSGEISRDAPMHRVEHSSGFFHQRFLSDSNQK